MDAVEQVIEYYHTMEGRVPYREWCNSIKNARVQAILDIRITRIRAGNFGDCVYVGDGVYELRIHIHSGFRIYFGKAGNRIVLLLLGGIKKSQNRDIVKAKSCWQDYRRRFE